MVNLFDDVHQPPLDRRELKLQRHTRQESKRNEHKEKQAVSTMFSTWLNAAKGTVYSERKQKQSLPEITKKNV